VRLLQAIGLVCAALVAPSNFASAAQRPPPPSPTAPKEEPPKPLDEGQTRAIVGAYDTAEHWALQAIMLLSLGHDFHPEGARPVLHALTGKEPRLRPYAVELLLALESEQLARVATVEILDALVALAAREKNELLASRAAEVLAKRFSRPTGGARGEWVAWWRQARATHALAPWIAPEADNEPGRSVARAFVERAFDLRDAGLDVGLVIDSTGSMQIPIDSVRDAIDDLVGVLAGIAPKLRIGLAHYKDLEDLGDGAQLLVPLTRRHADVRERLGKLIAGGGGDVPERVEKGVEVALSKEMDWNREANRLLLVIGDAPPHADALEPLLKLVKDAHDRPFARGAKPVSGKREPLRPFITSTLATSRAAQPTFEQIAKAGGGTCVLMEVQAGRAGAAARPGDSGAAARTIVEHVLLLSFGAQHRPQLQRFVRTFFEYRDAGLFE